MNSFFPPPPLGKNGWPWTEESEPLPPTMPDGSPWPKISIVTPSFNQAQYLEETIRSVLLQGYPNLEYIIIDGGSTDGSVEIIKKYEPWLTYWVSEPDRGQSHAINKGFEKSTGEIMAWINSDDYYLPGAFYTIAIAFANNTDWIAGACLWIDSEEHLIYTSKKPKVSAEEWLVDDLYSQPGVFWRRNLWNKSNHINEKLQYSFDYELWLQFATFQMEAFWIDKPIAIFRLHSLSKTSNSRINFFQEDQLILSEHFFLEKSFTRKIRIRIAQRIRAANFYLSKRNCALPVYKKIFMSLLNAPWYIFRREFYYKIKVLLFDA